ncbi:hypothetical protein SK128_001237 [Halocaridina rubra]|uniref:Uncharacterized protein n=1 Tax=Halocaridina rubra TaxID=373956 RepID=A0AAN9AGN5_HALRR
MDCTKFNQKNTSKSNSLNNHETALKSKNIRNDSTKDSCAASGKHELKELVRQKLQEEAENLKSENMKTVLSVMEKINLKQLLEPFSFSDLKSEAANIYKDISVRDNPAVFIPNLPNKVEISDKELKSFENCWKSAAEDLQEYIVRVDSEWRKGNMDTEKALMCRIEGKDITHILIDNDGNLGTENSSKNDDREISVTSSDVSDSISKSQSDTSKNKAMSRLNTIESKATSKRTSPRTKSKSKRSGENYQYMNGKSETGASQRKSMQETYNYYTRTHDHLGHSYESPLTYSNRQLYYTFDYGNSCGYSAPYQSKVDSMNENYQCNRSNGHYTSESSYTSHVNDYDNYEAFCRSSWYTYQRYLESAEKFASMMDYVQTIGRMSYWAARDYELCMNEKK